ncbi:MAG: LacI family transcriptional regulator [Pseudomonadota bacterium]
MSKPTLKTIAQATGLAQTTVSRALRDDPKIAENTRKRVADAAREIGYVPDRAAQRLRTGRTNVIALVLSPHSEIIGFRGSIMAGLSDALAGTSFHLTMTPYDSCVDPMRPVETIVRNRLADGVVFAGTQHDDPRVEFLLSEDFPFVTHGRTRRQDEHPWCDYDNACFTELALERLAERGRRRVVLFPPDAAYTFSSHMKEAAASRSKSLGLHVTTPNGLTLASKAQAIQDFVVRQLSIGSAPDAFICPGEVLALAVMAAIEDNGLTVGREVDIVAKQTSAVFDLVRPRVDTIFEDLRSSGRSLGQILLRRISGECGALQVLQAPETRFRDIEAPVPA